MKFAIICRNLKELISHLFGKLFIPNIIKGELAGLKWDKTDRNKLKDPGFAPHSGNTTSFIESHKIAGLLKKKVFLWQQFFNAT